MKLTLRNSLMTTKATPLTWNYPEVYTDTTAFDSTCLCEVHVSPLAAN